MLIADIIKRDVNRFRYIFMLTPSMSFCGFLLDVNCILSLFCGLKLFRKFSFKITTIVSFVHLSVICSFAQDLPKVILPSPEAVSLFKFQNYPVDHSTGLTQIGVPIYEVKSGSLSVPIGLSYHAAGRKVDDLDGPIALGWSLNAGGSISRTVKGSADFAQFKFPYPFNPETIVTATDYITLEQIMHYTLNPLEVNQSNWKDSEYDIFSYYFGNNSGKFVFKDENNVKTPSLLPYKPYVVTPVYHQNENNYTKLAGINILDDKGVLYEFMPNGHYTDGAGFYVDNEFSLTKIISADKVDTISFLYTSFNQTRANITETIIANDKIRPELGSNDNLTGVNSTFSTNYDFYSIPRIQQINFKQGKVVFSLVTGSDKIDNIKVFDKKNSLIKNIKFERSRQDGASVGTVSNVTNKLDAIVFNGGSGVAVERYTFEYFPTPTPSGATVKTVDPHHRDWWGYFNASGQRNLVPRYNNLEWVRSGSISHDYGIGNTAANREPNLYGVESGVLKKITYPTGGSTEFIYELNRYKHYSSAQGKFGPGLRIYQIKTDDRNGTTSYLTYRYGENENGYGSIDLVPGINTMSKEAHYYYFMPNNDKNPYNSFGTTTYRERTFYSDFIPQLQEIASRPVTYTTVTEYLGTPDDNTGKTIYKYDYQPWTSQSYQNSRDNLTIRALHVVGHNYWDKPSLINKKEYKNIANNLPYQLIKETVNTYHTTELDNVSGLHIVRMNIFPQRDRAADPDPAYSGKFVEPWAILRTSNPTNLPYAFAKYQINVGYKTLGSSSQTIYNTDGTSSVNKTSYIYNSRQLINSITNISSDSHDVKVEFKYPFDYQNIGVLSQMASPALNMLNYPIEEIKSKNSVVVSATKTDYLNWGTVVPRIYPQTIQTKNGTLPYEVKIRFHRYDIGGNLLSVSKNDGPRENYIWSYQRQYPVAKVINSTYDAIETLLGGKTAVEAFSYSNPLSSEAIENFISPLRASILGNLQVTSFAYRPLVGMTHQTDIRGMTTYYEYDDYQRLTNILDHNGDIIQRNQYNNNNGVSEDPSIYFNRYVSRNFTKNNCVAGYGTEVAYRVPANKYSSTVSQADADAKARADIQANGQNYANQNGVCFYRNALKERVFTRNNCQPGVNGSKITYTVPAGKYISTKSQVDADAMAEAEIEANGQTNVNENGTCGFYNPTTYGTFTRNNCPPNSIPSEETYTVPAKKYYSAISQEDADAKAQNDINTNGQIYANNNGTCKISVVFSFWNATTDNFGVSFYDAASGYSKSFTCVPGSSSLALPQGVYTVTARNISSNVARRIYVGPRTAIFGTMATFNNVNINSVNTNENNLGIIN